MTWLIAITLLFVAALAPLVGLLTFEIAAGWRQPRQEKGAQEPPPFAVLMPAHDEEQVLAATLAALLPQLRAEDRLLVIADNCSDRTAQIARERGVDVVERNVPLLRGKGYALDFGLRTAASWPHNIISVIDADCTISRAGLHALTAQVARTGLPAQACYQFTAPRHALPAVRFRVFALRVKNAMRLLGGSRLGIPCLLTGSGMAFPKHALGRVNLASGELAEDMLLGIDLTRLGYPPRYCPDALITSPLPIDGNSAEIQRSRWERGTLSIAMRHTILLLGSSLSESKPELALLAADIAIPPLSLLTMLSLASLALSASVAFITGRSWIVLPALLVSVVLVLTVWTAWLRHGRDLLQLTDLPVILRNQIAKLKFYVKLLLMRNIEWVRTARGENDGR
jgi:cellulose synthase/poly-beta-1,6-N-acetylglucosamine synthase-like glycosyltransferase